MSQHDKKVVISIASVIGVLAAVAIVFFIAANMVTSDGDESGADDERMQAKVAENIAPVGQVSIGEPPAAAAAPAAAGPRSGEEVYTASCAMCHASGAAGAPKVGDKAIWEPRAAQGIDTLLTHATDGLNAMPPKGTCAACSSDELKAAIEYMLQQTGL